MANASDVARYLVRLAVAEDEPDPLTHLRLQKLLYYVQGWSLARRDRPMFEDRIEAWTHGPIVPDVYQVYKGRGWASLFPGEGEEPEDLTDEEREDIAAVWKTYKRYSATRLRELTHHAPPWLEARRDPDPTVRCCPEITHESLKGYFRGLAHRQSHRPRPGPSSTRPVRVDDQGRIFYLGTGEQLNMSGMEPERILRGLAEFQSGGGQPLEEVLAELDEAGSDG